MKGSQNPNSWNFLTKNGSSIEMLAIEFDIEMVYLILKLHFLNLMILMHIFNILMFVPILINQKCIFQTPFAWIEAQKNLF